MIRPHGGDEGRTWSHLTTLYRHDEIAACNKTINDLLFARLAAIPRLVVDAFARVIGELHDNVASHANGRGFSSAQFYPGHHGHPDRLEISVADAGRGFLHNVCRFVPTINTDSQAITWCLQKGNTAWIAPTAAVEHHGWSDPYAESADRGAQADHHMGLGLWLLCELVRMTQSTLWIWSGWASYALREDGTVHMETTTIRWPGVLIDIVAYPARARQVDFSQMTAKLGKLAEELGL